MKWLTSILLSAALLFTGCALIPKKVELFQSKVKKFPEPPAALVEVQRQTAQRAEDKAEETLLVATQEGCTNVIPPAAETAKLTRAVAESLGVPEKASTKSTDKLIADLRDRIADLDAKVVKYAKAADENAGKKIEGTGLFQVPYFLWLGIIAGVIVLAFVILKLFLTVAAVANPGAAVGLGAVNVASSVVSKGFGQLVKGGELFKGWVEKEISDPALKQKVLDAFGASHNKAQDQDVQTVVKQIV